MWYKITTLFSTPVCLYEPSTTSWVTDTKYTLQIYTQYAHNNFAHELKILPMKTYQAGTSVQEAQWAVYIHSWRCLKTQWLQVKSCIKANMLCVLSKLLSLNYLIHLLTLRTLKPLCAYIWWCTLYMNGV
jgi:hypothetical protein